MKNFINSLTNEPIIDVIVSGYVDSESPSVFHPMYGRVYFIFNNMKFEVCIDDFGFIYANSVTEIEIWFDLDEDDKFSLMSIYAQLFKTEQEITVVSVTNQSEPFGILTLNYREGLIDRHLCLDPHNFFGFTFL
ncbi:hypothetical protein F6Q07_21890 [Pectobacterium parmentieri]|uniref:hypothetical protein n=1 Tax=Pectobacterium parmentieri TaxID=1905730 RepID=UPI000EB0D434|nr:hypothetical protein [Pectobacterium parmentieri]AYH01629.1 hypothetical protein C5E26_12135 [Pectobacterium parmentieri]AYH27896.1 hypothetical protein C5E20_12540 [Pectobacterium parmentieri]AYH32202.1 hypothetical protein C5E19_11570 [Pectobacterium parmentieri]MBI0520730.1 hypothetical protein [Pectobacterium parmentieri]